MGNGVTVINTASVSEQEIIDSLAAQLAEANERIKELERERDKFAIEQKIEAIESFVSPYKHGATKEYVKGGYGTLVLKAAESEIEQLRKEQEC